MKKSCIYIASLFLIISNFYSCSNDEDNTITPPPPVSETVDVETIIQRLTGGSSKTWKIDEGFVVLNNGTSPAFVDEYNTRDDEFTFILENDAISMIWKKGFGMNINVDTFQEFFSDTNESSVTYQVTVNPDTGALSLNQSNITLQLAENIDISTINLIQPDGQTDLSVNLTPKNAADFVQIPTTLSTPQELFSFDTGIFRVGFKVSQSQNSIYLTNRNDLAGLGAQQAFKYDLTSDAVSSFTFTQQDFATKNIEFLENQIVSMGGNHFENMDYDFLGVFPYTLVDNAAVSNGTASLDDTAYLFGGLVNGSETAISTWNMGNATFQDIATLPVSLNDMDGEIVDQVLYMFGGWDTPSSSDAGSNSVYTYNIDTGAQEQITIPVNLRETYTSMVENIIYVGGLQPIDTNNDGQFDDLNPYLGAFNTIDNSFQEITLNVGAVLDNKRLVHLQVVGNIAYFITSENLGAPDGYINRVYKATLNE
ncbi:hypothetical protein ACFO3O_04690 [Dokdonia ponticola]|uniref:DUF4270 family protein n=1 Tax=Dokdonia ponticola TaxID=2041041 RepID=A0ABV9HUN0_9FLAO